MFCPKCKDEFVPGIKECIDCKVPLVEELPKTEERPKLQESPLVPQDEMELVTVLETSDSGELMVAKSLLDSEGIRYITFGEGGAQHYLGQGMGTLSYLLKPIRLQVAAANAALAKELLLGIEPHE
jgi:hypothetical protein